MSAARRRGFSSGAPTQRTSSAVRTHMMFSAGGEHHHRRKPRRAGNMPLALDRLHQQQQHRKDEMVQTIAGLELDPNSWTGNQRLLHFGPLAQRDPFFYYYPKGWDILYPAHFGFFPYRTSKFRGSSPTVCLTAFGFFLSSAGMVMVYLAFFGPRNAVPFWHEKLPAEQDFVPPLQIAGPVFLGLGLLLSFLGLALWCSSLNLCAERMRHTQRHHAPPRRTIRTVRRVPELTKTRESRRSPYMPLPPPAYPVLANGYTEPSLFCPDVEMKLHPPIGSAYAYSTLSLHRSPAAYPGSPYNTLGAGTLPLSSTAKKPLRPPTAELGDAQNPPWPEYHHGPRSSIR